MARLAKVEVWHPNIVRDASEKSNSTWHYFSLIVADSVLAQPADINTYQDFPLGATCAEIAKLENAELKTFLKESSCRVFNLAQTVHLRIH